MHHDALQDEIDNIDSYRDMILRWKQLEINTAEIVTLEGELIRVVLNSDGWNVGNDTYPTVEAMLHSRSPKFTEEWNKQLYEKLSSLRR